MRDPFAAWSEVALVRDRRSCGEGGTTETSAPESTRNRRLEVRSRTKNTEEEVVAQSSLEPAASGAVTVCRLGRFPDGNKSMVPYTF